MIRPLIRAGRSEYPVTKRPDFVPGLLVVRIKEDVIQNMPPVRAAATAGARQAPRLPEAVEEPFWELRQKRILKEVVPVFAPMGSIKRVTPTMGLA